MSAFSTNLIKAHLVKLLGRNREVTGVLQRRVFYFQIKWKRDKGIKKVVERFTTFTVTGISL